MDNTKPAVINIDGLDFSYHGHQVLKNVNLRVSEGEFLAVIGPNGGGKTTLLKLMLGLLKPTKGSVKIFGGRPGKQPEKIGYVPQDTGFNRDFPISALDVVLMGNLHARGGWRRHKKQDREIAKETLSRMGILDCANQPVGELSGGQRQRLFIARALITNPALLLLDEPTANVDTKGQADIYTILNELNKTATIIVVSHDLMVLSSYIKSVACVNRQVHFHDSSELTGEMLDSAYQCPVELVAHGVPHRVLKIHDD